MKRISLFLIAMMAIGALSALAAPVKIDARDLPTQDALNYNGWADEIGSGFPVDESILVEEVSWEGTIPCPENWISDFSSAVQIRITNLTGRDLEQLVYVADPQTTLSNMDGEVEDITPAPRIPNPSAGYTLAFNIDSVGLNTPLVYESIVADNIFQAGEVWEFVIQDYNNALGLSPALLDSWDTVNGLGQVAYASDGGPPSSGSIVAIPEPSTIAFIGLAGCIGLFMRRLRVC
ncbi:PEP-CTERM sorting domain-containing protein [Pontiellaceae bacterium B12227]|nr:PEP-CTERM sorting domain-containing protein [Pontiellaceae bacterium B12227]